MKGISEAQVCTPALTRTQRLHPHTHTPSQVARFVSFGFSRDVAVDALKKAKGDSRLACEKLLAAVAPPADADAEA